jgi:hypothetical protein
MSSRIQSDIGFTFLRRKMFGRFPLLPLVRSPVSVPRDQCITTVHGLRVALFTREHRDEAAARTNVDSLGLRKFEIVSFRHFPVWRVFVTSIELAQKTNAVHSCCKQHTGIAFTQHRRNRKRALNDGIDLSVKAGNKLFVGAHITLSHADIYSFHRWRPNCAAFCMQWFYVG